MAENLQFQINYAGGSYIDACVSVSTISELLEKFDFIGQSVHMAEAFAGTNGIPYPVDFWMTPNGEDVKWEVKTLPSIESSEDLELLKAFMEDFKAEAEYYPLVKGFEFLVNGERYVFDIDENGNAVYTLKQNDIDDLITDIVENAVDEAVNKVTSGASEAFDTLKEVEDWIKDNEIPDLSEYAKKEDIPSVEGLASEQFVAEKIAEIEIPSVEGFATEAWVKEQNYLTEHQSLEGYAKIEDLPSVEGLATEQFVTDKIAEIEIPSVEGLATEQYVDEKFAGIEIPSVEGLATEEFVINKIAEAELGGEDVDLSGYATKSELEAVAAQIPSVEGLASEQFVTEKIAEIEIPSVEGLATEAWVKEQNYLTEHQSLEGYAKVEDIPSVEGLASEAWVEAKGYLTEHQSLEGYAKVEDIPSVEGLASEAWVEAKGYLTEHQSLEGLATEEFVTEKIAEIEIPSVEGLASEAWVEAKGYLTEHQSLEGLATEEFVTEKIAEIEIPSVEGLASEEFVINKIAEAELGGEDVDLSGYATKSELEAVAAQIPSVEGLATEAWVEAKGYLTEHQSLEGLATEEFVTEKIGEIEIPSVEGLATEQFVTEKIGEIEIPSVEGLATEQFVTEKIAEIEIPSVEGLASEAWVEAKGYLTEHQDISGLATKEEVEAVAAQIPSVEGLASEAWVEAKGYLTEHQSLEGLATEQYVDEKVAGIEIPSVEGLASEAWVEAKGYLTEHQSLEGYAKVEDIPSVEGLASEQFVTEKIAEIEIPSVEGLASEAWVEAKGYLTEHQSLEGYAKVEDIPSVEGLASEAWVEAKGYLTEHQDISGLATKEEVEAVAAQIPSVEGLASEEFVINKIAEAKLEGEDVDLSGYATKSEVEAVAAQIPSVEGLASEQFVTEKIAEIEIPSVEGLASEAWVKEQNYLTEHQSLEGLATEEFVTEKIGEIEIPSVEGLATEAWVEAKGYLTEHQDISGLATKEEVESVSASVKTAVTEIIEEILIPENAKESLDTLEEISSWIQSHPEDAAAMNLEIEALSAVSHTHENKVILDGITAEQVSSWDNIEENVKTWVEEKGYLTEHQDISGLATKEEVEAVAAQIPSVEGLASEAWVEAKGYLTEHQSLEGLATEEFVTEKIAEIEIPSVEGLASEQFVTEKIAEIEIPSVEGLATEAWVEAKGYLTEHQDISGLATKEEVSDAVLSAQTYADGLVENLKPYNGGIATDVVDYTVNVNVAEEGFLEVNEDNELTVTGVTLDAAVTSKDITIEGGQWATAVKTVFTGGTVPAGTTWQSFLESMLCVEKFDTSYSMSKTFTVSCGTIGNGLEGASNNESVEVGTKVTLKAFGANTTTASQSFKVSTFDYGYKLGENGDYNKSTSYSETLTPTLKESNNALTATFTKFVDENGDAIANISQNTSIDNVEMRVMDGSNTVVLKQTGDTYTSSSAVTAGTIYVATNLKNYYKSDKKTPNTYTPIVDSEDKTATASTTYTVTGYRNTFYGTTNSTEACNADYIRELNKSNKAIAAGDTISFDTESSDGHLRMTIASPRTIKTVKNQTGTQDLTALLVGTKTNIEVGGVDNFDPISYNVYDYTWKGAFGNETWIITFA